MRCVNFPRNLKRLYQTGLMVLSCASGGGTWAAEPSSFVYCLNQAGTKIFAGNQTVNGDLTFGISLWSTNGHNISIFGLAHRDRNKWVYADDKACRLTIARGPGGGLRVRADRKADCRSHGGVGTEIGHVRFPGSSLEGQVTVELDDAEAFQKAGRCGGGGRY